MCLQDVHWGSPQISWRHLAAHEAADCGVQETFWPLLLLCQVHPGHVDLSGPNTRRLLWGNSAWWNTAEGQFTILLHSPVSSLPSFPVQWVPSLSSLFSEFPPFLPCSVSSLPFFTVQWVPSLPSLFREFPPFLPCLVSSLPFFTVQWVPSLSSLFSESLPFFTVQWVPSLSSLSIDFVPFLHCSLSSLPSITVQQVHSLSSLFSELIPFLHCSLWPGQDVWSCPGSVISQQDVCHHCCCVILTRRDVVPRECYFPARCLSSLLLCDFDRTCGRAQGVLFPSKMSVITAAVWFWQDVWSCPGSVISQQDVCHHCCCVILSLGSDWDF